MFKEATANTLDDALFEDVFAMDEEEETEDDNDDEEGGDMGMMGDDE